MSITVEQFRFAIEEDETPYPQFTTQESWTSTRTGETLTWDVGPANGQGWHEISGEDFKFVIDGELLEAKNVGTTGGMDEGSNATSTWQVGDQYFRKSGYYASHYGYDWDGELEEVRPVQKVVTVFE